MLKVKSGLARRDPLQQGFTNVVLVIPFLSNCKFRSFFIESSIQLGFSTFCLIVRTSRNGEQILDVYPEVSDLEKERKDQNDS